MAPAAENNNNNNNNNNNSNIHKYSYKILKKKIQKVDEMLQKLLLKDQEEEGTTKEYRALERKRQGYQSQLEKTSEYKEQKLQNALQELHSMSSLHSMGSISIDISKVSSKNDSDKNSSSSSSGSSSSSSSGSSSSSSSSSDSDSIDYELTLKKYDKTTRLMEEIKAKADCCHHHDHKQPKAETRADYKKYLGKQKEHLALLNKTEEWKHEAYRRMEQKAIQEARARAQAEQEELIQQQEEAVRQAREAQRAELELQKQEMLAKLRAERAKKEELEQQKEAAYLSAQKLAERAMQKGSEALEAETKKREEDYRQLLKAQEERGMIRLVDY